MILEWLSLWEVGGLREVVVVGPTSEARWLAASSVFWAMIVTSVVVGVDPGRPVAVVLSTFLLGWAISTAVRFLRPIQITPSALRWPTRFGWVETSRNCPRVSRRLWLGKFQGELLCPESRPKWRAGAYATATSDPIELQRLFQAVFGPTQPRSTPASGVDG